MAIVDSGKSFRKKFQAAILVSLESKISVKPVDKFEC